MSALAFPVRPASPADRPAAVRLLAASVPPAERDGFAARLLSLFAAGEFDPSGLFVAGPPGGVCGAGLAQSLRGAVGLVWPPRVEPGGPAVEDALAAAVCGWLRDRGVKLGQSFPSPGDDTGLAALGRQGFRPVTQLAFLRRDPGPAAATVPTGLRFEPVDGANSLLFADTLLRTYDGSLDCPEMNGVRTADEVLDGFRPAGGWYVAREGGAAVGVVVVDPAADDGGVDLLYLGLVPAARGRGLGGELVRFAVGRARAAGGGHLSVSVDVRNRPALRLYARHAFTAHDLKDVHLAVWHPFSGTATLS